MVTGLLAAGVVLLLLSLGLANLAERTDRRWSREATRQLGLLLRGLGAIALATPVLFLIAIVVTGQTS